MTGSNLRNIMLLLDKNTINEVCITDVQNIVYATVSEENKWKISCVKELIDILHGDKNLNGFSKQEVKQILDELCIN